MIQIAILGYGTVGSGVMEVIETNSDRITRNSANEIKVKYILDVRDFSGDPHAGLFVDDFSIIENDPDVTVVVETIGGVGVALDFTRRSLNAGKSVVTSNKELVAAHGHELIKLAREKGTNYLFEASVGGGIPILRPITQCLAANKINEIYGILNGTTNYILTEMIGGLQFEDALRQAQENGYAEANPESDIEGHDACRKICILSALCFGRHVYPEQVPTEGITNITLRDIEYAEKIGSRIKLLGRAVQHADGKISAYVAPHLVSETHLLAGVEGVMNGIVVRGNAIGDVMFYGAGAGKLPTASAVVADVIDAVKHANSRKYVYWEDGGPDAVSDAKRLETLWYVRTSADAESVRKELGEVTFIEGAKGGEQAFITKMTDSYGIESLKEKIPVKACFRVLE